MLMLQTEIFRADAHTGSLHSLFFANLGLRSSMTDWCPFPGWTLHLAVLNVVDISPFFPDPPTALLKLVHSFVATGRSARSSYLMFSVIWSIIKLAKDEGFCSKNALRGLFSSQSCKN